LTIEIHHTHFLKKASSSHMLTFDCHTCCFFFIWNLINYSEKVQNIYHDSSIHKKKTCEMMKSQMYSFFFIVKIWQNNRLDHGDTLHAFPKESKPVPHANVWGSPMLLFYLKNN
jgi:hypothetical protein